MDDQRWTSTRGERRRAVARSRKIEKRRGRTWKSAVKKGEMRLALAALRRNPLLDVPADHPQRPALTNLAKRVRQQRASRGALTNAVARALAATPDA